MSATSSSVPWDDPSEPQDPQSAASQNPEPQDWDFLAPDEVDPLPEPGDFYPEEDFEDWLEDF